MKFCSLVVILCGHGLSSSQVSVLGWSYPHVDMLQRAILPKYISKSTSLLTLYENKSVFQKNDEPNPKIHEKWVPSYVRTCKVILATTVLGGLVFLSSDPVCAMPTEQSITGDTTTKTNIPVAVSAPDIIPSMPINEATLLVKSEMPGMMTRGVNEDNVSTARDADSAETTVASALPYHDQMQANILKDTTSPKPDALGTMTTDNKSIDPIFLETNRDPEDVDVLDEVWSLIDKYYIDRSFGGNKDWNLVHKKYSYLISKATTEDARFKLVSEMVASLGDKYSRILDRNQYAAIQKYDLIGVGVTLMPDAEKHIIVGAPPITGSEADKAGLKVGDFVTAINGVSTEGRTAFDIIDQISENPAAPTVRMTIRPKGSNAVGPVREVVMARAFAHVKNPISYKISERRPDGTIVGFIKIQEFNSLVKGNLEQALSELETAGANAYVIDIRQNTGGAFQSAVEISGLFMENRIATYVVDNTGARLPFRTTKDTLAIDNEDPVVIWIDKRSASASEVFAGSLHDNCRAVLVGEKSFGKGLIQAVYGLKNGAGLVLTVARYVSPAGNEIQGVGIQPDLNDQYLPFGLLGSGTDTSKINFTDIKKRLSEQMCRVPDVMN